MPYNAHSATGKVVDAFFPDWSVHNQFTLYNIFRVLSESSPKAKQKWNRIALNNDQFRMPAKEKNTETHNKAS